VKKELRFGFALMAVILLAIALFMPWGNLTNEYLGLLMLADRGGDHARPTAFTLMGMELFFASCRTAASTRTWRCSRRSTSWCSAPTA
jgi:hypothetical protein